ncbi:Uncharacterised protein [Mycobacteroides abscessus subsp. abscessus]|nr:Uncharacterised protein [Mycobacteroides abscessus subsp. abscessus]
MPIPPAIMLSAASIARAGPSIQGLAALKIAAMIGCRPQRASLIPPLKAISRTSNSAAQTSQAAAPPPARGRPCNPATAAVATTTPAIAAATRRLVTPADQPELANSTLTGESAPSVGLSSISTRITDPSSQTRQPLNRDNTHE